MKKIVLFVLCILFAISGHAQLIVDSLGRMSLSPNQIIVSATGDTTATTGYSATIHPLKSGGIRVRNLSTTNCSGDAISILFDAYGSNSAGLSSSVTGHNAGYLVYGARCTAGSGYQSIGVFGGLQGSIYNGAGIYGSSSSYPILPPSLPSGRWAGLFAGDVKSTGTIYGTLVSPSSVSSPSDAGTTTNLSEQSATRGGCITEKLQQVDLLQMERVNQNGSLPANKVEEKRMLAEEERAELGEDVDHAGDEPIQTRLSDISYGLAADQLQEVFPELVYEDAEGNYSINYVEMVPLLVQSIRELKAELAELRVQVDASRQVQHIRNNQKHIDETEGVSIVVPEDAKEATLAIYDLNGRFICNEKIIGHGATSIKDNTKGLTKGTYACTLIVDGKAVTTRKVTVK